MWVDHLTSGLIPGDHVTLVVVVVSNQSVAVNHVGGPVLGGFWRLGSSFFPSSLEVLWVVRGLFSLWWFWFCRVAVKPVGQDVAAT